MANFETQLRDTKVQLRMRPLQKDVIARAAHLKQTTLTNFMVEQAFHAAQQILADQVHFYLSPEKMGPILRCSRRAAKRPAAATQAAHRAGRF